MPTLHRYAVVVDDHPLVAHGMKEFLGSDAMFENVHTCGDAQSCVAILTQHGSAAVVVLDFWLAGQSAPALIKTIRSSWPEAIVLVVSGDSDPAVQEKVRQSGAHGFLRKSEPAALFSSAIAGVLGGVPWFYPASHQHNNQAMHDLSISYKELELSHRQGQILDYVLQGLPNKRIAQILCLSESTIKEHITGILRKLDVSNRVEAITKLRGRRLVNEH